MALGREEIRNRFGFHKGTTEGPEATAPQHRDLRLLFIEFVEELDLALPDGRAKSVAFAQIEDASMWAHKSVAEQAPVTEP